MSYPQAVSVHVGDSQLSTFLFSARQLESISHVGLPSSVIGPLGPSRQSSIDRPNEASLGTVA
ncbi:uncharacterized protein SETTUDRAFT_167292 [Exserohilum turcica Et28A]|uniref:Uncharacterized protein n=1 Tax=Exserohilum turcicum (strain 28A) TaxID=671987 RepID=R0KRJ6_EXST2|nr:uncharacterized protein SETTUDRAFT_167292 [Exserohilum turcica Et28A]EOA90442.1 hypothetical protein SETTUDRAFT_167292 [Exserohilum turcica Et28A]